MNNEKKIEDYLHLYLGVTCKVGFIGNEDDFINRQLDGSTLQQLKSGTLKNWVCKPILRPLSSMTEEEAINFCLIHPTYGDWTNPTTYINGFGDIVVSAGSGIKDKRIPAKCEVYYPDEIKFILSKHFDLFGLIEAGLAIDSTKLPTESK